MADEPLTQDQIISRLTGQQGTATPPANPAPNSQPPTQPAGETPGEETLESLKADRDKWKALSRKNEDEKKSNADKAKAWDEYQISQQTEAEKAAAAAAAAATRAAEAESKLLRYEVANTKGVPAALLVGSTKEELEASADALIAFKGTQPAPTPNLGQGNRGSTGPENPNDWLRRATGFQI